MFVYINVASQINRLLSLSISLSFSISIYLYLSIYLSISMFVCFSLSLSLGLSLSISLSLDISLNLSLSLVQPIRGVAVASWGVHGLEVVGVDVDQITSSKQSRSKLGLISIFNFAFDTETESWLRISPSRVV